MEKTEKETVIKRVITHMKCENLTPAENEVVLNKLTKGQCSESMAIVKIYTSTEMNTWSTESVEGVLVLLKDHKRKSFFIVLHDLNPEHRPLWAHEIYRFVRTIINAIKMNEYISLRPRKHYLSQAYSQPMNIFT